MEIIIRPATQNNVDGHSGYISLQALHWLSRNKVPVFAMKYDGTIISSILPPTAIKADLRAAQFQATNDSERKFSIAHALVKAKITRSLQVIDWLAQRYDIDRELRITKREAAKLGQASSVAQLRTVEGRVALRYWEAFRWLIASPLSTRSSLVRLICMISTSQVMITVTVSRLMRNSGSSI